MTAPGLLPCPFCGGEAKLWTGLSEFHDGEVQCECGGAVGNHPNADAAIAAWHTRAPDPLLAEALEALREVSQALAWQCYGECRGWSDNLLGPGSALDRARAVLAKMENRK